MIYADKKTEYENLVKDVQLCIECDKYRKTIKAENIILEHDKNRRHINLWAEWQGSLDAEILLIGKDWGRLSGDLIGKSKSYLNGEPFAREIEKMIDSGTPYLDCWGKNSKGEIKNHTDRNIASLFNSVLGLDIRTPNKKVFFTNSVQCYKPGNLNSPVEDKWFECCNRKFIPRLISIIQPKMIISLGESALTGLRYCGSFTDLNGETLPINYFNSYNTVLDNGVIKLSITGLHPIPVCPVPHAGYFGTLNRKKNNGDTLSDWQRIYEYIS